MPRRISLPLLIVTGLLPATGAWAGGAGIGPGVITLPPITTRYDDRCLDRIDRRDERLAARQARECRKPRSARATPPPAADGTPPPVVQPPR